MKIYTIQMCYHNKVKSNNFVLLDITAKSGNKIFAPEYSNVMKHKRGELTDEEYTELYLTKMRISFVNHREEWEKLKYLSDFVVVCYCKENTFCHRYIFVELLRKFFDREGISYRICGELK